MLEFKEYIKGKSVAFVGMAPSIVGKGLGKEIDSFDIVIRTNVFPIPEDYRKDYGTKCEVISMLRSGAITPEAFVNNGVKWVIHYRPIHPIKYTDKLKYFDMTMTLRMALRKEIKNDLKNGFDPGHPSAGVNIIGLLLKSSPARIKVFGITGYQNKQGEVVDHTEYRHYIHYFKYNPASRISMRRHPSHHFQVQNDWIRLLLKTGKIQMDPFSREYFK